jgi:hypothetical protein
MRYDKARFEQAVEKFGEVFFVLDSGEEYIVHGKDGFDFVQNGDAVRTEGMQDDEWLKVEFPLDSIEHHYSHKEI